MTDYFARKLQFETDVADVAEAMREGTVDFTIVDTAGLEDAHSECLAGRMLTQTKKAIEQSDAVFFMLDAKTGPVPDDRAFADLVRRSGKPAIVVANKAEGQASTSGVLEAYALGLGEPVAISAEHGEGMADLFEALREALPEATAKDQAGDEPAGTEAAKPAPPPKPTCACPKGKCLCAHCNSSATTCHCK